MPGPKKENDGTNSVKGRGSFRTDGAISNSRFGNERKLTPWVPDANLGLDESLEKQSSAAPWDQFAVNEQLFGVRTDYDENMYTTTIDKSHPQYRERMQAADKKAKEIERSTAATAHVAEERVMDYVSTRGISDENEEDKYSGVRRVDLQAPVSSQENRYTPPAKRAPSGQPGVKGAPVDPAIISSQLRDPKNHQKPASVTNNVPAQAAAPSQNNKTTNGVSKVSETKSPLISSESGRPNDVGSKVEDKTQDLIAAASPSTAASRTMSPRDGGTPNATDTVEIDVLKAYKSFATQQRNSVRNKARADKEVKLTELKRFANTFKLSTPVPTDLVSIIAKDPHKQKEIQAKAIRNAEDMAKNKADFIPKDQIEPKEDGNTKPSQQVASKTPSAQAGRGNNSGSSQSHSLRGQGSRQSNYNPNQYAQTHRGPRAPNQVPVQQPGSLGQRLRQMERDKMTNQSNPGVVAPDGRLPPTGPSNVSDPNRRNSALPATNNAPGRQLNPNTHEFRPNPFAVAFSPNGNISVNSSPRSAVNNVSDASGALTSGTISSLIRRKTNAVDPSKCNILAHIETIKAPQGRNWDDNGGLRPSYDTLPTWRQLKDDEKADSTMHLKVKDYFEQRQPFTSPSVNTPVPGHAVPQLAHQHQLPFHLQQGAPTLGVRQSPHMTQMRMDHPQPGSISHSPYNNDDHRMMHSNSSQSYASPRPGPSPMAYPSVHNSTQMPYGQPVFMGPGNPQMGQFRGYPQHHGYMPNQQGQIGGPIAMQPHFIQAPQGMMPNPQMMYPGHHPQFMPPSGPPQPLSVANGYPSPGRPTAPMMAHQGSQQGQAVYGYGMSPGVQYNQPTYGVGHPGAQMSGTRGYNVPGSQHYGGSPQQGPHFAPQHRNNSNGGGFKHKNLAPQVPHSAAPSNNIPSVADGSSRTDNIEEGK